MEQSKGIAAFEQHGVVITNVVGAQASGLCPWCHKAGKFFLETQRLVWDCKVCGVHGNLEGFLEEAAKRNVAGATPALLGALSKGRGGILPATLREFGVGWRDGEYTLPAWGLSTKGAWKVTDVRRYQLGRKTHSTSGAHLGLVMRKDGARGGSKVWVCEGEWDCMAWAQVLGASGMSDDVVGVCGAANFPKKMAGWFCGKEVVLLFDHDDAGQAGCARAWGILQDCVGSLRRMAWEKGLPDGYDVRDLCIGHKWKAKDVLAAVQGALVADAPAGTVATAAPVDDAIDPTGKGMAAAQVEGGFREWLDMPTCEPLDVMYGAVIANRLSSDPLWLFMVAPSGGSKSELLMTLDGAPLVHCITCLTPHSLISGMNLGGTDPSLIPKIIGKTLVVKDFTTILAMDQGARDEIFGVLRDAYDGRIEKGFGNAVTRKYIGKFGLVAGVTPVIDSATHGNSVLGERFIKYRIRHSGKLTKSGAAMMRALDNMQKESDMRARLQAISVAVLNRPLGAGHSPRLPQWFKERLCDLAHLVAALRGMVGRERYTQQVLYKPVSEHGTRLVKQFAILALGIAVYRGLDEIDEGVYRTICHVAMDTAPDRQEEILKQMFLHTADAKTADVAQWAAFPADTCRYVLEDMAMLGLVDRHKTERGVWVLNKVARSLLGRLKVYEREQLWMRAGEGER